jgi:hypothetical protein
MGKMKKAREDASSYTEKAHGRQSDWSTGQPLFVLETSFIRHLSEIVRRRQEESPIDIPTGRVRPKRASV